LHEIASPIGITNIPYGYFVFPQISFCSIKFFLTKCTAAVWLLSPFEAEKTSFDFGIKQRGCSIRIKNPF